VAVVSAGPYASLHLAADRQPLQHPTTQFFTGRMPFLSPNQQRQSTEGSQPDTQLKHYQIYETSVQRNLSKDRIAITRVPVVVVADTACYLQSKLIFWHKKNVEHH